jgi:hypothetical protein
MDGFSMIFHSSHFSPSQTSTFGTTRDVEKWHHQPPSVCAKLPLSKSLSWGCAVCTLGSHSGKVTYYIGNCFFYIYIYIYIYIEKEREREREIISNVKLWCDSWLHLRQLTLYSYDQNQSKSGICIFSISVPRNCPSVWGSNILTHTEYRCSQHFFPTKWCTLVDWEEHPTKDTMDHGPNTPECRSKRNE